MDGIGNISKGYFNPRSHTGSDCIYTTCQLFICISIHAPTRGATQNQNTAPVKIEFQSTLPHGERQRRQGRTESRSYFNPRSHTGSDLPRSCLLTFWIHFNPRSHTGSDSNIIQKFRIFSFICDNYKYTLHFYASFCECIIPHNKKYAAYIWCESHRYFMCACHSHSTCYKTRG